jgi:hypothetical protein
MYETKLAEIFEGDRLSHFAYENPQSGYKQQVAPVDLCCVIYLKHKIYGT